MLANAGAVTVAGGISEYWVVMAARNIMWNDMERVFGEFRGSSTVDSEQRSTHNQIWGPRAHCLPSSIYRITRNLRGAMPRIFPVPIDIDRDQWWASEGGWCVGCWTGKSGWMFVARSFYCKSQGTIGILWGAVGVEREENLCDGKEFLGINYGKIIRVY